MKQLTEKEEELMRKLWNQGEVIARDLWESYPEPRPHFNTITTFLRILEQKGWVKHKTIGNTNLYSAKLSEEEFGNKSLKSIVSKFFKGSLVGMVSSLLKEEKLTEKEIRELMNLIEAKKND